MSLAAPTPPLLLTKRLTAFLRANLSAQIHTAVLTTVAGKLLTHASPHSVATLRTQATVAASLWALYATRSARAAVDGALSPQSREREREHDTARDTAHNQTRDETRDETHDSSDDSSPVSNRPKPSAITVQLAGAVVVIRHLRCGLLFVCIGPSAESLDSASSLRPPPHQQSRPVQAPQDNFNLDPQPSPLLGSPSEAESVASTGAATTASIATTTSVGSSAVVAMRRQAEELARCLNDRLDQLDIPDERAATLESR
ncbi:hypothetical protein F4777DRAFT_157791 [Nemania sp. FL0916]|nr:hypothetical protein F4777DRAFT_157791 [Nemania sp. FL0916]